MALCIACHRFKGAGEGEQGPDLGQPMNPVDYFKPEALAPAAARSAAGARLARPQDAGFGQETLSDQDLDAIIAWLTYKARR